MKTTRTTKIRIETRESRFVRFGSETSYFCLKCVQETRHLPVAQMATLLAVTEKTVFRLAESEQVQSAETEDGHLLICMACSVRCGENSKPRAEVLYIGEVAQ